MGLGFLGTTFLALLIFISLTFLVFFFKNRVFTLGEEKTNKVIADRHVKSAKFCSYCGNALEQDWKVCPYCANQLNK